MGKKSRNKKQRRLEREKKKAEKCLPKPYTHEERVKKINNIMIQLMNIKMEHVLTPEVTKGMNEFRDNGMSFHTQVELPEYSRVMIVDFENDKNKDKDNAINFQFKKIRIEGEGAENPINKLNKMQEDLL